MKLNNKGFAVSTILYGVLTLTILILMIIFGILKSNKDMNEDLVENLTDSMNSCVHIESKLESCYFNNEDCDYIKQLYTECIQNKGKNLGLLVDKILLDNNGGKKDDGMDFSKISSDTNGNGLYYTSTNTEDNKTTYYFRGDVENNYVEFAGFYWRIVRINEDGSIRLITQDSIGTSGFNNVDYETVGYDNADVGYMYGTAGSSTYALTHTNTTDSTIKDYLDNWYTTNLSSYSSYIADAGFCNDRSVASDDTASNLTYYGSANRLVDLNNWTVKENAQPQFACPNPSNDLFTTSTSTKGNKALTNPIGLITMDEAAYAGAIYDELNESMYLANGAAFWTMSPFGFGGGLAGAWHVHGDGLANLGSVGSGFGVRPVINLKIDVEATGNGTINNPYIVKTN